MMPSGMPSIGDDGRPSRQRAVERSVAAPAAGISWQTNAPRQVRTPRHAKAEFEKFARRLFAGGKIRSGGKEWHRLRQRHRVTP
jgi:hypothetical protein